MTRRTKKATYVFRLYVTGESPRGTRTLNRLRAYCEDHFAGRYTLDVIDIYVRPKAAREAQVVATPTLVKVFPLPARRFVGDLTGAKTLFGLELPR